MAGREWVVSWAERPLGLLEQGVVEVTRWDWFDAAGARLRNDSHTARASAGHGAAGLRMNPYHTQVWALTKSLLEMQNRADWVVLVDVDEFWNARDPHGDSLTTLAHYLTQLPPEVEQHPFCAVDLRCTPSLATWRPKSAMRVGSHSCEWWGHPHSGIVVEDFVASEKGSGTCGAKDAHGKGVNVFSYEIHTWDTFNARCQAEAAHPGYHFEHRRPHQVHQLPPGGMPAGTPAFERLCQG